MDRYARSSAIALSIIIIIAFSPIPPYITRAAVYSVVPAPNALTPVASSTEPTKDVWQGYADLKEICGSESSGSPYNEPRQFDDDGVTPFWGWDKDPLHPGHWIQIKRDVGACQINTIAWGAIAARMGLDVVHSYDDNIAFAKWLYDRYGVIPWMASEGSWGKAVDNKGSTGN